MLTLEEFNEKYNACATNTERLEVLQEIDPDLDISEDLICPLTQNIIDKPVFYETSHDSRKTSGQIVTVTNRHTYEQKMITDWVNENATDPLTRKMLTANMLKKDITMINATNVWLDSQVKKIQEMLTQPEIEALNFNDIEDYADNDLISLEQFELEYARAISDDNKLLVIQKVTGPLDMPNDNISSFIQNMADTVRAIFATDVYTEAENNAVAVKKELSENELNTLSKEESTISLMLKKLKRNFHDEEGMCEIIVGDIKENLDVDFIYIPKVFAAENALETALQAYTANMDKFTDIEVNAISAKLLSLMDQLKGIKTFLSSSLNSYYSILGGKQEMSEDEVVMQKNLASTPIFSTSLSSSNANINQQSPTSTLLAKIEKDIYAGDEREMRAALIDPLRSCLDRSNIDYSRIAETSSALQTVVPLFVSNMRKFASPEAISITQHICRLIDQVKLATTNTGLPKVLETFLNQYQPKKLLKPGTSSNYMSPHFQQRAQQQQSHPSSNNVQIGVQNMFAGHPALSQVNPNLSDSEYLAEMNDRLKNFGFNISPYK